MSIDIDEQYDKVYRFCYFKLKNQHLAEDITQETFLRFLKAIAIKTLDGRWRICILLQEIYVLMNSEKYIRRS